MVNAEGFKRDLDILLDWRLCHRDKKGSDHFDKELDRLFVDYGIKRQGREVK